MRKICSVIIAVVMMFLALIPVANAVESSEVNITITPDADVIKVAVKITAGGVMTAQIMNKTEGNENPTFYDLQSDRTPEKVYNASGKTVGYKYEFSFGMSDAQTGKYIISVGNNVNKTQKEFPYIETDHKVKFYDNLETKAPSEIYDYFTQKPEWIAENVDVWVPMDEEMCNEYTSLSAKAEVMELVNETIAAESWATGVEAGDSVSVKRTKLSAKDKLFTEKMSEWLDISKLAMASEETWAGIVSENAGNGFDNYFYNSETVGTAALDISDACSYYENEALTVDELMYENYYKAFDKATLVLVKETRSAGVLKNAFLYFENKNTITADMTNINALINAGKDSDLWKNLKADTIITDCASLIASAEAVAQQMVDDGALSAGGNAGGGGSLGGGSSSIDKESISGGAGGGGGAGGSTTPTTPVEPVVPTGTFSDITNVEWAKEAIEALAEKGVLNGKGDGKFVPDDSVTREEFVKIIVAAFEFTNDDAGCDFSDVAKDRWSYSYIAAANKLGIVSGDGTNFNPTSGISRQDMAVIIFRVFDYLKLEVSGDAISFDDGGDIADYAKEAVDSLTAAGIINGMGDGTFAPRGTVTRAQAAKVVYGLLNLVGGGK